jgi:hypothetical protein
MMEVGSMTQKEALATFIVDHPDATLAEWSKFQVKHPFIRIKTVGPKNEVQINLDQKSGFIRPKDWLRNYRAHIQQQFEQELNRALNVLPPERVDFVLSQFTKLPEDASLSVKAFIMTFIKYLHTYNDVQIFPLGLEALKYAALDYNVTIDDDYFEQLIQELCDDKLDA